MGTSRRTILTLLTVILPCATLASVGAEASTRVHVHHAARATLTSKAGHRATHRTAQLHTHAKVPAAG